MKSYYKIPCLMFVLSLFIGSCINHAANLTDNTDLNSDKQQIRENMLEKLDVVDMSKASRLEQLQTWVELSKKQGIVDSKSYSLYSEDNKAGRLMFAFDNNNIEDPTYKMSFQPKITASTPLSLSLGVIKKMTPNSYITDPIFIEHISIDTASAGGIDPIKWYISEDDTMIIYAYGKEEHIYTVFGIEKTSMQNMETEGAKLPESLYLLEGKYFDSTDTIQINQNELTIPSISLSKLKQIKFSQLIKSTQQETVFKLSKEPAIKTVISFPAFKSSPTVFTHSLKEFGTAINETQIKQGIRYNNEDKERYLVRLDLNEDGNTTPNYYIGIINQNVDTYVAPEISNGVLSNSNTATLFKKSDLNRLVGVNDDESSGFVTFKVKYLHVYMQNGMPVTENADANIQAYFDSKQQMYTQIYSITENTPAILKEHKAQYSYDDIDALVDNNGLINLKDFIMLDEGK